MTRYLAPAALLPAGWTDDVLLEVDDHGWIRSAAAVATERHAAVRLPGPVVPGVVNGHSHAFQRGLAGGAELRSPGGDTFWGWREALYRFLDRLGPDEMEAVAVQLYTELLEQGYTRVVEFHYLHHDPRGVRYADPMEMSHRLAAAAAAAGIGLTLLPVLYQAGDFGGARPAPGQLRFLNDCDGYLGLLDGVSALGGEARGSVQAGIAFHSLRAVPPSAMDEVMRAAPPDLPVHIHAAEQPREVRDCQAWSGLRPVEWLLHHQPVDRRWSLVHCTHMRPHEVGGLASTGATVVVCPSTEGNLGDGLFALEAFLDAEGSLAIGSDSHVSTSPVEELRWLEYGQRLATGRRAVAASDRHPSPGRRLLEAVGAGGAAAAGVEVGALAPGHQADWVVLDPSHPVLAGRRNDGWLDAWVFSGNQSPIREVWTRGRRVVAEGRHPHRDAHARAFRRVMSQLMK
ncbi:MAG: formimidoylglutamate deiminase [Gemmatimonadota bacterium]